MNRVSWFEREPGGSTIFVKPPSTSAWKPHRFFWWNARDLTYRWRPLYLGGTDEFDNRTLGVRLPGGVLFVCLNWPLRRVGTNHESTP